jgi:hypothetical protein
MGYSTQFYFDTVHKPWETYEDYACKNDEIRYVISNGSGKWYDHDDDMKALSKLFPDEVFILRGVGEEFPDVWRKAYKNGQMYSSTPVITFPAIQVPGCTVKEYVMDATR